MVQPAVGIGAVSNGRCESSTGDERCHVEDRTAYRCGSSSRTSS
jgi:hypothetical protein